jgi:hypothetical protein
MSPLEAVVHLQLRAAMIDPGRQIAVTAAVSRGSEALAKSLLRLLAAAKQQPSKAHGR